MTKTINVTLYPRFTQKDLIEMLQLRPGERTTLSDGYVAQANSRGLDSIEVEIEEKDYEVDE